MRRTNRHKMDTLKFKKKKEDAPQSVILLWKDQDGGGWFNVNL